MKRWQRALDDSEEWLAELATGRSGAFVALGERCRIAADTGLLLTLDSDTQLPPGRLRELVAIHAHPLNAPVWDAATRRVTSGYSILQPRVVVPLPLPGR